MTDHPTFPPLFESHPIEGKADPFAKACTQALLGCDSGLVVHNIGDGWLKAAIVFAPETALQQSLPVWIACEIGFQNALGALAPPEVAVHFTWQGGILVNGAGCGRFRAAASTGSPGEVPDWIVIGLELPLIPPTDDAPGRTPDQTCLFEEGCAEVEPVRLLEAWVRHSLVWINRMNDEGLRPLNADWRPLVKDIGEEITVTLHGEEHRGTFLGVDEFFGMLLRQGEETSILPLSLCLEGGDA